MFGRKARLPIDKVYGTVQPDDLPLDSFVNDMSVVLEMPINMFVILWDLNKTVRRNCMIINGKAVDLVWLHSSVVSHGES